MSKILMMCRFERKNKSEPVQMPVSAEPKFSLVAI